MCTRSDKRYGGEARISLNHNDDGFVRVIPSFCGGGFDDDKEGLRACKTMTLADQDAVTAEKEAIDALRRLLGHSWDGSARYLPIAVQ